MPTACYTCVLQDLKQGKSLWGSTLKGLGYELSLEGRMQKDHLKGLETAF